MARCAKQPVFREVRLLSRWHVLYMALDHVEYIDNVNDMCVVQLHPERKAAGLRVGLKQVIRHAGSCQ